VRTEARFPRVAREAGHYESFYLKATRPSGGQGIWIRHTVHKPPGSDPSPSLWLTLFDADAQGPTAMKATYGAPELSAPDGAYIRIDGASLEPGRARGELATPELEARWDLRFDDPGEPFHHLPYERLYEASLPRTKLLSPYPLARFAGSLVVAGESIDVAGWPGMIGHNWGTEHAERWVWLEGTGFADAPGTYFDAGAARIKLGSRTSPWVPSGMLVLDGVQHRLGGLGAIASARIDESPSVCSFLLPGKDLVVHGRVAAPEKDFVGWVYADPNGPERNTVNCSVADLELTIERPGLPPRELTLPGGGAYELGMRETDHGIPIQPFPDG
jgi:hypothetical protein